MDHAARHARRTALRDAIVAAVLGGTARFNPNHDPDNGEFSSGGGSPDSVVESDSVGPKYAPATSNGNVENAVRSYRDPGEAKLVNTVLRGGDVQQAMGFRPTDAEIAMARETADHMRQAIASTAPLTEPTMVWRGIQPTAFKRLYGGDPSKLEGMVIEDKGLVSTTRREKFATDWAGEFATADEPGIVAHITIPAGARALNVERALALPHKTVEAESVLPPGGRFTFGHGAPKSGGAIWVFDVRYDPAGAAHAQ